MHGLCYLYTFNETISNSIVSLKVEFLHATISILMPSPVTTYLYPVVYQELLPIIMCLWHPAHTLFSRPGKKLLLHPEGA